jgi:hypothetical protein
MNEIRETRSRKGVRLFSRLAEVFEAVQDYIGRTLKSLLVCNQPPAHPSGLGTVVDVALLASVQGSAHAGQVLLWVSEERIS